MKKLFYLSVLVLGLAGCTPNETFTLLDKSAFETTVGGKKTSLYTLKSNNGVTIQVTNFGARVVSIWTPDKNGDYEDISIGYENIDRYVHNNGERFLGCVVGRYANRIAKGQFEIDGISYQLPLNNNGQTLHGGLIGVDMVAWDVEEASDQEIKFSYTAKDGDDGFPGNLKINMIYSLSPENEFRIDYKAVTDKPTVVNLSNHSFFNLKGEGNGTITDHVLTLNASATTPVDSVLIPTGEIAPVDGSPFDFRKATVIGARIDNDDQQLKNGMGYDHNWVLDNKTGKVALAATVYEPASGRVLEVYTDQPAIQFYSGNFFDGKVNGKSGKPISYRESLALETQKFPDSPNHQNFPSTRLNPGETYTHTCVYKFSVKK
ncbi:MAG: galactose mutarotase [Prevotellaceae bacterium]|jgi:aldose 1-epimerase|nr:galactose mutarotase [Prevotellaceae bacterium]